MSNATSSDLVDAKKNLQGELGENMKRYYQLLKAWFKQKMTREDFDHEARKLLTMDSVRLHNQFILALLCKCHSLGSTLARSSSSEAGKAASASGGKTAAAAAGPVAGQVVGQAMSQAAGVAAGVAGGEPCGQGTPAARLSRKLSSKKRGLACTEKVPVNQLVVVNPLVAAPHVQQQAVQAEDAGPAFSTRHMALPDAGMLHGRLIVGAWENALDDVSDAAVAMLHQAVQVQVKQVLMAALSRRGAYRLREGRCRYALGAEVPPPSQRSSQRLSDYEQHSEASSVTSRGQHVASLRPSVDTAEQQAAMSLASLSSPPPARGKLSLLHLYSALQVHKSAIPCHSVYATSMERMVSRMSHACAEELQYEHVHRQQLLVRQQLHAQHVASTL